MTYKRFPVLTFSYKGFTHGEDIVFESLFSDLPFSSALLFGLRTDIHPADNIGAAACASPNTSSYTNPDTGSDGHHSGTDSGSDRYDSGTGTDGHHSGTGANSDPYCSGTGTDSHHSDNHYDSCIERGPSDNHHDNGRGHSGLYEFYEQLRCR